MEGQILQSRNFTAKTHANLAMRFNDCSDDGESYSGYGSAHTLEKAVRDPMNAANTTSNDHGSSLALAVNDYPGGPPS